MSYMFVPISQRGVVAALVPPLGCPPVKGGGLVTRYMSCLYLIVLYVLFRSIVCSPLRGRLRPTESTP